MNCDITILYLPSTSEDTNPKILWDIKFDVELFVTMQSLIT